MDAISAETYSFTIFSNFITHLLCLSNMHLTHSQRMCTKHHPTLYNCAICEQHSQVAYSYQCRKCKQYYCLLHYFDHIALYSSQYCSANGLALDCVSPYIRIARSSSISTYMLRRIAINAGGRDLSFIIDTANDIRNVYSEFIHSKRAESLSN